MHHTYIARTTCGATRVFIQQFVHGLKKTLANIEMKFKRLDCFSLIDPYVLVADLFKSHSYADWTAIRLFG